MNDARRAAQLVLAVLLLILVLEGATRGGVCMFGSNEMKARSLPADMYDACGVTLRYEPHPYLTYQNTPDLNTSTFPYVHNSHGFRGPDVPMPKPNGTYRIALIGGSSTYSLGVADWRNDIARTLQRSLNQNVSGSPFEVINAGVVGYTSWENLINLQLKVLPLDPDMVIIYQGVNDVRPRLVPPSRYRSDNTGFRTRWTGPSGILASSTLLRLLAGYPVPGISAFVTAGDAGIDAGNLAGNPPTHFRRNLRNMVASARADDAAVVLATWAYNPDFDDYVSRQVYQDGVAQHNAVTEDVGAAMDVPVFDFAAVMPRNDSLWETGRHVSVDGARLKGRLFAGYLQENDIVPAS